MSVIGFLALQGPCASRGRITRDPHPGQSEAAGGRHGAATVRMAHLSLSVVLNPYCLRPFLVVVLLTVQICTVD